MKLHFNTTQEKQSSSLTPRIFNSKPQSSIPQEIDLSLTINFSGEQEMEVPFKVGKRLGLPGGKVTFGVRRGRLHLNLNNCKMPLETITLNKAFKISISVETQTEQGKELQIGASGSMTLGEKPSATGTGTAGIKAANKAIEKTTVEVSQVKQTGSEKNPAWIFEAWGEKAILEGALTKTKLGTLQQISIPCYVKATFRVRGEDIRLTWGKLGLTKNVIRNKLAVIERALSLKHISPQLESCPLSEVSWQYD